MDKMIRAVLVEDEKLSLESLAGKLKRSCLNVEVVAQCRTGEDAIRIIHDVQPDLVFLDIRLGTMSGFDVLERLNHIRFETIITTSHDQYAIRAIKANALDFLLKPVNDDELIVAVNKAWFKVLENQHQGGKMRIAVPIRNGLQFVAIEEIPYCEAFDNLTYVHLWEKKTLLVSRTLKRITAKLPQSQFFRIHRTYTVNRDYVDSFSREDGGRVLMKNGKGLPVSTPNRDDFLNWLMND